MTRGGLPRRFIRDARGATAVFCLNARGAPFRTPAVLPGRARSFVSSSVREQVGSLLCRSGRSEVRRCNSRVPCFPPKPPTACDRPAANSPAFRVDSCTVLFFGPSAAMGGFTQWADRQKGGGDGHRAPRPGSRGGGSSRRVPAPTPVIRSMHDQVRLRAQFCRSQASVAYNYLKVVFNVISPSYLLP